MAGTFEISADMREERGKAASRRMRRLENLVPGIIYGADKDPVHISINHFQMINALKNEAFYSHILTLNMNGSAEKVVLKDLQRHPYKPQIMHVDFLRVSDKEKLYMHVPLHFVGIEAAPGIKLHGGVVHHLMNEIEIRCFPADLPEYIEIDISTLGIDESIHLSELPVSKGVEVVALIQGKEHDQAVVSITKPHVAAEPEGPVVVSAAEVPVVGKERKEEGGEEKK